MGRPGWLPMASLGIERSVSPQCHGNMISREAFSHDFSEGINGRLPLLVLL
jgi:hypothetical protein